MITNTLFPLLGFVFALLPLLQIQTPPIEGVGQWVWHALGALAAVVLVLTALEKGRKAFGRTPSIDTVLAGLATMKHLDDSNARVTDLQHEFHTRSRGLEEQISALRHEMRGEYQATVAAQQELSEEVTEQIEGVREKIESSFTALDDRRRVDVRALHTELSDSRVKVGELSASVTSTSQATDRKIDSMDQKLDRLIERVATAKKGD